MSGSENPVAEPRPAASLTAGLLARRGGASPAMRRQLMTPLHAPTPINDDLGWNDMGEEPVVAATPVQPEAVRPDAVEADVVDDSASPIALQLKALAERIAAKPMLKPRVRRADPASLIGTGRKAAFTLRIDPERHLRLRLLSAVTNRSAQQLLIEALDSLIARNDQLQDLADQIETRPAVADMKWGT